MKKNYFIFISIVIFVCFTIFSVAQSNLPKSKKQFRVGNPVIKGYYADPEGVIFDNRYWIYPTYSAPFNKQVFFDAFSSSDFSNWEKHEKILSVDGVAWIKRALWAPSIIKSNDTYYLFFSANNIQNNKEYGGIGVATSKSPSGPFKDAIGRPLIDSIINGAQPIDQFVFCDDDGQFYMYYGGWGHCNVAMLNKDLISLKKFKDGTLFKEITPDKYVEGPFMLKRKGKYYFMWSEGNWTGSDYCVAYAISDSPIGPFKRESVILKQDSTIGTGAGHHSVIKGKRKDEYYIVYHRRPLTEVDGNSRETCIDVLRFTKDGHILPIKMTKEGVKRKRP